MTPIALASALLLIAQAISPGDVSRDAANRGQGITTPRTGGQSGVVAPRTQDRPVDSGSALPDFMVRADELRPATPAPAAGGVPAHWTGDAASWDRHRAACTERYGQTYDPRSDTFRLGAGDPQRCVL